MTRLVLLVAAETFEPSSVKVTRPKAPSPTPAVAMSLRLRFLALLNRFVDSVSLALVLLRGMSGLAAATYPALFACVKIRGLSEAHLKQVHC